MKFYRLMTVPLTMLFCFCFLAQIEAKSKKNDSEEPEKKIITVKIPVKLPDGREKVETMVIDVTNDLDEQQVEKVVTDLKELIKKEKEGDKSGSNELLSLSRRLMYYSYHPQLEEVMGIYKSWYMDLAKCLDAMSNVKREFYLIQNRKDNKIRAELAKKYKTYSQTLIKLIDKPRKIKKEDMKKIREAERERRRH